MTELNASAALLGSERGPVPLVPPRGSGAATLAQAAQNFEAYMIRMLLGEMQKSIEPSGLFGDASLGGYRALIDDALAKRAAEAGSFGLAHQLLAQWEARQ